MEVSDITIVVCNHNTPNLIVNLLESIEHFCETVPLILVMNTGKWPILGLEWEYNLPNTPHGDAVNKAIELVRTRYMLLVDSDVLFLQDFKKPFNKFVESGVALMGEVVGDRGGKSLYPRVNPWYCFMDLKQLRDNGIVFYDHYRTKILKSEKVYDIGSSMFEDVVNKGLKVGDAKMENKYFKHYEGMSWRVQKYNPDDVDTDIDVGGTHNNKALHEYGLKVMEQYERDVKTMKEYFEP